MVLNTKFNIFSIMVVFRSVYLCQHAAKSWQSSVHIFKHCQRGTVFSKKFSTSPLRTIRNKWPEARPKVERLEPQIDGIVVESGNLELPKLLKPFLFTVAFSTTSFAVTAIWEFENVHRKRKQLKDWFRERRKYVGQWRNEINKWWNGLTEGERLFAPICFLNILVFLAWKVPALQLTMVKYFCSNPAGRTICWPMVLSTFSHYSAFHIFANMYVLHSFSSGCVASLGKEQFLGLYLAAGTIASFASYIHKVVINRPGLSLGASGAIMAILGYSCTKFPDLQLSIIFLPFLTFKASLAIKCIMGLDAAGVLLGWRFFDHAAHLGGALFGVFWAQYGGTIWSKRGPLLKAWYELRGPFSKD